jgi:hypothetical protein
MTHHTTPTLLEVLSYLTDATFTSVVVATIAVAFTLQLINRIGGAR